MQSYFCAVLRCCVLTASDASGIRVTIKLVNVPKRRMVKAVKFTDLFFQLLNYLRLYKFNCKLFIL